MRTLISAFLMACFLFAGNSAFGWSANRFHADIILVGGKKMTLVSSKKSGHRSRHRKKNAVKPQAPQSPEPPPKN